MADKKISELPSNPAPGATSATVPVVESAVVAGNTVYTNYQSTVKNIVISGINAEGTTVDGGNF